MMSLKATERSEGYPWSRELASVLRTVNQSSRNALGQMVSGIAHDFNNALMPIIGLPEHMLTNPELMDKRDEVARTLRNILTAAHDAREIVRRLREFCQNAADMALHPVNLQELVREAASEPGHGTTFSLYLPINAIPQQQEKAAADVMTKPQKKLRVLVVDDDNVSRKLLARYLRTPGHDVTLSDSGQSALRILKGNDFDLLITDRAMPGISGDELAKHVAETAPQTRIIMLTGFGDIMQQKQEKPHGVNAILGKPTTSGELLSAINALMSQYPQQSQS